MSRTFTLALLLLLVVFISQSEWKQQIVNEVEASTRVFQKRRYASERDEAIKEKIILTQEKVIKKLNELVQSLQEQLLQCGGKNEAMKDTAIPLAELLNELDRQQLLED